jgi:hypothetical protein
LIDLETRLLELLDWDEEQLQLVYEKTRNVLNKCDYNNRNQVEKAISSELENLLSDEGVEIIKKMISQLIRKEEMIAEA